MTSSNSVINISHRVKYGFKIIIPVLLRMTRTPVHPHKVNKILCPNSHLLFSSLEGGPAVPGLRKYTISSSFRDVSIVPLFSGFCFFLAFWTYAKKRQEDPSPVVLKLLLLGNIALIILFSSNFKQGYRQGIWVGKMQSSHVATYVTSPIKVSSPYSLTYLPKSTW